MAESRFGRFWARLWSGVVADLPASLEECESCRVVDCTQERWLRCERRLIGEANRLAENPLATTTDLPQVTPAGVPSEASPDTPTPAEEVSDLGRRRKHSVH